MFAEQSRAWVWIVVSAFAFAGLAAKAQPSAGTAATPEPDLLPKEIQPGVFELGDVRIDKRVRTITFPARLNLAEGAMEYLLVTGWGKTHESILQTKTEPYRIHVAMLLLNGAGPRLRSSPFTDPSRHGPTPGGSGFISHPSKTRLPGGDVRIEFRWTANGREIRRRAEDLLVNGQTRASPRRGEWVYNGSRVWAGVFLAEREGSLISLVTDPEALMNNEAPGHDSDTIWTANTNNLPPPDAVVEVAIKLGRTPVK